MESSEFIHFFNKVPHIQKHFLGVFPIDKLPTKMPIKTFLIANLEPSFMKGSHWIAFFKLQKHELEIFDSLGTKINYIIPFLKFSTKLNLLYNETIYQSNDSKLCGKFVITFCVERLLNPDMLYDDLLAEIFDQINKEQISGIFLVLFKFVIIIFNIFNTGTSNNLTYF